MISFATGMLVSWEHTFRGEPSAVKAREAHGLLSQNRYVMVPVYSLHRRRLAPAFVRLPASSSSCK